MIGARGGRATDESGGLRLDRLGRLGRLWPGRVQLDDHRRRFFFVLYSNLVMIGPIALLASLGDPGFGWWVALTVLLNILSSVSVYRMTRRAWATLPVIVLQSLLVITAVVFLPAAGMRIWGDRQAAVIESPTCGNPLTYCDDGYWVRSTKDDRLLGPVTFENRRLPDVAKGTQVQVYVAGKSSIVPLAADEVDNLGGDFALTVLCGLIFVGGLEGAVRGARRWPGPEPVSKARGRKRGPAKSGGAKRGGRGSSSGGGNRGGGRGPSGGSDSDSPVERARQAAKRGRTQGRTGYEPGTGPRPRGGK